MEIIHLILGKANPNRMNGVNKVVYQLATEQAKAGKDVKLWGISKNLEYNYPERAFDTLLFKAHKNPFKIPASLKDMILDHKKAVFHLHGGWIPVYYALSIFFKKHGISFVITPHGAYNTLAMEKNKWVKKIYFQLFEKRVLKNTSKIHAIGKSEVDGLIQLFPNEKYELLQYGFQWQLNSSVKNKNQPFTIGFMGRLDVRTKGLDILMETFKQFQVNFPEAQLWIIGDGDGSKYLKKFIVEHQVKNVTLWGKKYGYEKQELLSKLTVFVHPSRNEGLPSSVLEASSFGVPSIVSESTNVGDFIENYKSGYKIPDESVTHFVQALNDCHKKYNNHQMGSFQTTTIKMLQNEFSWEKLIPKFDKIYVA